MVLCKEECSEWFLSSRCQSEQIGGVCSEGALTARLLQVNMADPLSFHTGSLCSSVPLSVLSCIFADRVNNKCPAVSALLVFGSLSLNPGQQQPNFGWRLCMCSVQTNHMTATLGNIWMGLVKWTQEAGGRRPHGCLCVTSCCRETRPNPQSTPAASTVQRC